MAPSLNLNDAGEQRSFDLIPDGTIVEVQMIVRPGGVGDGGLLKRSANGQAELLDCEFVVTGEGDYYKRKFWATFTLAGTSEGHAMAADITRRTLRAMVESAYGYSPKDMSDAAVKARNDVTLADFQGMRFIVKVGVKQGDKRPDGGTYDAKNIIREVITPDRLEWKQPEQDLSRPAAHPHAGVKPSQVAIVPVNRPDWAN
jgi:hypothetical protein